MQFVAGDRIKGINTKNTMKESDILHEAGNYYVSNEGTKLKPSFHVWIPGITHSTADSAYSDFSLVVARCNYLYNNSVKINHLPFNRYHLAVLDSIMDDEPYTPQPASVVHDEIFQQPLNKLNHE